MRFCTPILGCVSWHRKGNGIPHSFGTYHQPLTGQHTLLLFLWISSWKSSFSTGALKDTLHCYNFIILQWILALKVQA